MPQSTTLHQRRAAASVEGLLKRGQGIEGMPGRQPETEEPGKREQQPLYMDLAPVALWSLLLAPWLLWFGACGLGLMHHEWGHVGAPKEPHLMHEFDRYLFKPYGALLPFPFLLLRVLAMHLFTTRPTGHKGSSTDPRVSPPATKALQATGAYLGITLIRLAVYGSHLGYEGMNKSGILGDHLLLAASVVAILQSEMLFAWSDILCYATPPLQSDARQTGLAAAFLLNVPLYILLCMDMYFSCRHYHHPAENAVSLLLGFVCFQLPLAAWHFKRCNAVHRAWQAKDSTKVSSH